MKQQHNNQSSPKEPSSEEYEVVEDDYCDYLSKKVNDLLKFAYENGEFKFLSKIHTNDPRHDAGLTDQTFTSNFPYKFRSVRVHGHGTDPNEQSSAQSFESIRTVRDQSNMNIGVKSKALTQIHPPSLDSCLDAGSNGSRSQGGA